MRMKYVILMTMFFSFLHLSSGVYASGGFDNLSDLPSSEVITQYDEIKNTTTGNEGNLVIGEENGSKKTRDLSEFLTDVLTYQTAILVLLIPLSFDVVSRISDRYRSEVIIKRFQSEWAFQSLIGVLVFNVFYILVLRFLSVENFWWNSIAMLLTVVSMLLMGKFFLLIFQYTSGTSFIKEKLINDAKQLLK